MNKRERCMEIYHEAFGRDEEFDRLLFDCFFDYCVTLEKENDIVSMMFVIPCRLKRSEKVFSAAYIYAVATAKDYRGRGYMSELIDRVRRSDEKQILFLKPVKKSLESFYGALGFKPISATGGANGNITVEASKEHKRLSSLCKAAPDEFTVMYSGSTISSADKLSFPYLME